MRLPGRFQAVFIALLFFPLVPVAAEDQAQQAVGQALARIHEWNPKLNAVIAIDPTAMSQAEYLDSRVDALGPLHGMPVLVKDNIQVAGLPTTAGSLALAEPVSDSDAPLVARMREAGLVITGKANLSEWANFRSERSSSGWSGVGGQTRNPHDPSRSPCGSSSGSAVAVAAGMVPLAVGTETNGSIICPAATNGIVGIKPTLGLVSQQGIVPIAHSQDTAGPMAMTVRKATLLLMAMATDDDRDYRPSLRADGLVRKRIGIVRGISGRHEGVDRVFDQAVSDLRAAGGVVVDQLNLPDAPEGMGQASYDLLLMEFKQDLNGYLSSLPGPAGQLTLEKLIEFNRKNEDRELRWFGQEILIKAQATGGMESPDYADIASRVRAFHRSGIDQLLQEHQLDLLVSPSNAPAWSIDLINGDNFIGISSSSFPARAGYPHITVPMGFVHHLPVGLSFYASAKSEPTLIEAAYAYEQATRHARLAKRFETWESFTPLD